ncbi:L-glyceraldehyde 3-phosphate reductase [Saccharicrinis carchari]|uniref:L-glyceraldehyde 3-phosphate reductase n=1 Tax=Saccharicrinis carchari TaxID=1168039 RepID=A0A521E3M0_SACCC|nr:aldo/keto reductase [Saccharicrinis carchari]SMO77941.1 L-glyceraldehyde 3-phosphate reductase [Saccharicrinis carchari]
MTYIASESRYQDMSYRRCGNSGLKLSALSLGLWHNFGDVDIRANYEQLLFTAFDLGITHFDLANNYGPPEGSAEKNFGDILHKHLRKYRDELIISSKAGYYMWPGPYGEWGSKKNLMASLHQSLKRMRLDYVDIFYHHRPDPDTPLYETMSTLDLMVRQGKALYVGLSNYPAQRAREAFDILRQLGTPCLIHQPKYSMFERTPEEGLLDTLMDNGVGCIPFSPLAQGMLTDKYIKGIPEDSRAARAHFLKPEHLTDERLATIKALNSMAMERGDTLAQMAINWLLKDKRVTSVLIGASKTAQIKDAVHGLKSNPFTQGELDRIETILSKFA